MSSNGYGKPRHATGRSAFKSMMLVGILSGFFAPALLALAGFAGPVIALLIDGPIVIALSWVLRPAREDNRPGSAALAAAFGTVVIYIAGALVLATLSGFVMQHFTIGGWVLGIAVLPMFLIIACVVATAHGLAVYIVQGGFPRPPMNAPPDLNESPQAPASAASPDAPVGPAAVMHAPTAPQTPSVQPPPTPDRTEPVIRVGSAGRRHGGTTESGEFTTWTGEDEVPGPGPANKA